MKEFKENQDMYSVPRINAWTASILANRLEEVYEQEVFIEIVMNNIMEAIWEAVEEGGSHCTVDFTGKVDDELKLEVLNRLGDLGYMVKMGIDTEEEVEMFMEYESMAEEDESVANMLDEAYCSSSCYVIFWDNMNLGGLD